ncbi:MAG: hypothetical protein SynsKO_43350 [Synoicihabitans sp.]
MTFSSLSRIGLAAGVSALLGSSAFAQINNFDSLNGYAAGSERRLSSRNSEFTNLRAPRAGFTIGVDTRYSDRSVDPARDRLRRNSDTQEFKVDASWGTESWAIGAVVGFTDAKSNYEEIDSPAPSPTTGTVDGNGTSARAFLVGRSGLFTFEGSLGFADVSYDGTRNSDIGSSVADYDGSDSFGFVRIAYDWTFNDSVLLKPFAGVVWVESDADGFTEMGTSPDRRIVGGFSTSETNAVIGTKITAQSGNWKPFLTLSWFNELSTDSAELSIRAINGFDLGTGVVPNSSTSLFHARLGVNGDLENGWKMDGSVEIYTGGDQEETGFRLAVSRSF